MKEKVICFFTLALISSTTLMFGQDKILNYWDKNLHSSVQAISELPWLKELFQKKEIIIFSSMKMKNPEDHFGIVLFQNGQYVLIGLEKNEEDFLFPM